MEEGERDSEREVEKERETHRSDRETHRQCAVFKPGIISCITEIQKERVKRNKVEWSQRPEALFTHKYICYW